MSDDRIYTQADLEAAVSVVRAERDRAREEVRARDDDAALEVERVKRGARELGRILDQTLNMALDISGRQDVVDADGDGDWGLVWETLAELRPRAEAAEAEVERLTQIVARRTAHAEQAEADLQALREGLEATLEFLDGPHPDAKYEDGKRAGAQMIRDILAPSPAEGTSEAACPGCGSTACKWKRLECEREVTR